jgi:hypothetical protein
LLCGVSGLVGIPGYPAYVVDAGGCGNVPAAGISEIKHVVFGWLVVFMLSLNKSNWDHEHSDYRDCSHIRSLGLHIASMVGCF